MLAEENLPSARKMGRGGCIAAIENAMRRDLRDGLESILSANVEAVLGWLDDAVKTAEVMATREAVQSISAGLAKTDAKDLAASPLQAELVAGKGVYQDPGPAASRVGVGEGRANSSAKFVKPGG